MSNLPFQVSQEEPTKFKPAHYRFEEGSVKDNAASLKAGRAVYKPVIRVFVRAPGDEKCEVPFIVEQDGFDENGQPCKVYPWELHLREKLHHGFKTREEYDYSMRSLEHWRKTEQTLVEGTPITEWQLLSKHEADNLKSLGILSIEQVSEMTEVAMDSYGMGARSLKEKAAAWLSSNDKPGVAAEKIVSLEAALNSAEEKASEASLQLQGYAQKLAALEALVAEKSGEKSEKPSYDVDYENMEIEGLVNLVKAKGLTMAHKGWSREKLIEKLTEV